MAEDLAKISAQNEVLNQQVEKIPSLQKELEVCVQWKNLKGLFL